MDLTQFYFSILTKFDRQLSENLDKTVKQASRIEKKISIFELKGMLCEALEIDILDSNLSQVVDQVEDLKITFAYILKCLSLYPLKHDIYHNWNKHVALFDQAELKGFSEESICELHGFIQSIVVTRYEHAYLSLEKMQQPIHLIMLLLIHLDVIITLDSKMGPLCFNQLFKFRFINKKKRYSPSNSFSEFLVYLVTSLSVKKPLDEVPSISALESYPIHTLFEDRDEIDENEEHPNIKKIRQLIKKMRAEDRFCYLRDIDLFFKLPSDLRKLFSDENYEKVAESNARFLISRTINDNDFATFNDMNALWLIYYFQFIVYEGKKMNAPEVLQELSSTREFINLWKMFYAHNCKKTTFQWPAQFNDVAKVT